MAQAVEDRELRQEGEGRQGQKPGRGPIDWLGGWRTCLVGCSTFLLLAVAIRIFQQYTAWTVGIDASSEGFAQTYRALYYAEVLAATIGTLVWWGYLVRKGRTLVNREISHDEEVRRTAVRDTALTPSHIPMFYLFFPLGITITVGTYLYGRYWLPKIYGAEKGFPWSFFF